MEIQRKEVDCIFFKKLRFPHNGVRGNPDWEPGCILKDYYCSCAFEKAELCSGCVPMDLEEQKREEKENG